jgi:hypothetical protein
MSGYYETGHVKNVANFLKYNQYLATLGATYNPSNITTTIASLTATQTLASTKQSNVNTLEKIWKENSNNREIAINALPSFSTQLLGVLKSTDATQQSIIDFAFLVGKMRGDTNDKTNGNENNKTINPSNIALPTEDSEANVPLTKSNSQQSFDQRIEHFEKMILILQGVPSYAPNEINLQILTLQAQLLSLKSLNALAEKAKADLKAARIDRNLFFYAVESGFLDLIKKSKNYIKGVFGQTSQQYKTALTYKFVRVIPKKKSK